MYESPLLICTSDCEINPYPANVKNMVIS